MANWEALRSGVAVCRRAGLLALPQSAHVFVDANGLIYATDYNAGLYILEFAGAC
jgi:hypothetical protein